MLTFRHHFRRNNFRSGALARRWMALLLVAGGVLLVGCGGEEGQQADDQDVQSEATAKNESDPDASAQASAQKGDEQGPVEAVCIYQGAPVRESAGSDGDYVTSLNVGETFTFLNETEEGERGGETKNYSKVRLKGGDEGWVRSDMIVTNAKPAAVRKRTVIHERPTPMASTDKSFQAMDVVAVTDTQDSWVKAKGIRRGASWWDAGWVRPDALTQKEMDVAVSGLWKKAREEQDSTRRRKAIKQITENPSFTESVFVDSLKARLDTSGTS